MPDEIVHTDTFALVYEGEGLDNGEMDVFDLAPALLAVGETFRAADTALNGSETVVTTSVRAEFQKGSFEILFSVEQHLLDATVGILPTLHLLGANLLISTVIGSTKDALVDQAKDLASKAIEGLFNLLGKLGGEEPKEIRYDESTRNSLFILGNNNRIVVEQNTTGLYQNPRIRSAASKVAAPLKKSGIKSLKAKKGHSVLASVELKDFPELEAAVGVEAITVTADQPRPQTLIVRILKPDFVGDKWSVTDGGKPYTVSMADEAFKSRVHAREVGFYDGDMYRVRMETEQKVDGRGLNTKRKIVEVLEPVPRPRQQALPAPDGGKIPSR